MKLLNVRNPIYNQFSSIDCEILIDGYKDYIPFTASGDDKELHGRQIYTELKSGKYGDISPYVEPDDEIDSENQAD